uniref:F-box C protein n=1 Tax=Caenorhabditis tropicalis TaxID=1561998 RepID=A0A1I7TAG9_9PELO
MNGKPLTYDSLKTVILYMDPNTRILLSSRIPSIRIVEKRVPLRIKELELGDHRIRVNGTSYSFEVYQMDGTKNVPDKVSGRSKLNNKDVCDVDEFGIRDYITRAGGMLPGNNGLVEQNLFGEYDRENIPSNEGRLERLEKLLEVEKQRYNQLLNYCPRFNPNGRNNNIFQFMSICQIRRGRSYNQEELELLENEEMVKKAVELTKERIERMKRELLPFENKRYNFRPKFEIHILKGRGIVANHLIERINYTGDLHKAGEYLIGVMFGKRRDFQTNLLKINLKCKPRFPPSLKMKVKRLFFHGEEPLDLDLLRPVIDESSIPIEQIAILKGHLNPQEINHELIENCQFLELSGNIEMAFGCLPILRNQKVHIQIRDLYAESHLFITLIRNWIATNKPIGTYYLFSTINAQPSASEVLNFVKNQFEGSLFFIDYVDIPMANGVVRIGYERDGSCYLVKMPERQLFLM